MLAKQENYDNIKKIYLISVHFQMLKGNQVKILSDPVTVNREFALVYPLCQ